jgi:hypothetical protein
VRRGPCLVSAVLGAWLLAFRVGFLLRASWVGILFSFGFGCRFGGICFCFSPLRFPTQQGGGIKGFLCFCDPSTLCAGEFDAVDTLEEQLGGFGLLDISPADPQWLLMSGSDSVGAHTRMCRTTTTARRYLSLHSAPIDIRSPPVLH